MSVTNLHSEVRSMAKHAAKLRQAHRDGGEEAQVGYRLNQTHDEACGVTVDITGPSSCHEAAEIDGNIPSMVVAWEREDSGEAEATSSSRGSYKSATKVARFVRTWQTESAPPRSSR